MDGALSYWMETLNTDELKQRIENRDVYIWGAYSGGHSVELFLQERGINIKGFIDGHKKDFTYVGKRVFKPEEVTDKQKNYIIITVIGIRKEILDILTRSEYREDDDYTYISSALPEVTVSSIKKKYIDNRGNIIEFSDEIIECNIKLVGFNNRVYIGSDFQGKLKSKIIVKNGSQIVIGNHVVFDEAVSLEAYDKGKLFIGDSCNLMKDSKIFARGGSISLGNYVSIGERFFCINAPHSPIEIGDDCMISHDVTVLSTSSHSIFDLTTKQSITMNKEKYVKIGNHVWLGKGSTILYNSNIGDGCIIGACSIVKSDAPNNCVLAGNIAKIVKEECTWDRRFEIDFSER